MSSIDAVSVSMRLVMFTCKHCGADLQVACDVEDRGPDKQRIIKFMHDLPPMCPSCDCEGEWRVDI